MFRARFVTPLLLAAAWTGSAADPGYYVVTAYDSAGVATLDLRYWTVENHRRPKVDWPEIFAGYGVNSRWTTGLLASWVGSPGIATRLSTLAWVNDLLLTQGQWPLDVALHLQLNSNRIDRGNGSVEFGPVLQTDFGRMQVNANLLFERATGLARSEPTMAKYQWQLRYRWRPRLHVGLQGFGELGEWDDWAPHSRQSHRGGPALFGSVAVGDRQTLKLSAAWLQGRTYRRSGHMLSLRAAVDF